jgi:hypothetical protein
MMTLTDSGYLGAGFIEARLAVGHPGTTFNGATGIPSMRAPRYRSFAVWGKLTQACGRSRHVCLAIISLGPDHRAGALPGSLGTGRLGHLGSYV